MFFFLSYGRERTFVERETPVECYFVTVWSRNQRSLRPLEGRHRNSTKYVLVVVINTRRRSASCPERFFVKPPISTCRRMLKFSTTSSTSNLWSLVWVIFVSALFIRFTHPNGLPKYSERKGFCQTTHVRVGNMELFSHKLDFNRLLARIYSSEHARSTPRNDRVQRHASCGMSELHAMTF